MKPYIGYKARDSINNILTIISGTNNSWTVKIKWSIKSYPGHNDSTHTDVTNNEILSWGKQLIKLSPNDFKKII